MKKKAKWLMVKCLPLIMVLGPGFELGWIAPLVFEISASTNSAIWHDVFCL